jgi:hypothetical protein
MPNVGLEHGTLTGLSGDTRRPFDVCFTCGHLRTSHLDVVPPPCWASVSTRPDCESYWRSPCLCLGYTPDDGRGRWTFDGKRVRQDSAFGGFLH